MSDYTTPAERREDQAYSALRAFLSLVPGGGVLIELLNTVVEPAYARNQRRWLEVVAHGLAKLQEEFENLSFDDLQRREGFSSTFLRATKIAATTHRGEKLEALRNAVLNAAFANAPDDDMQAVFLSMIEAYTPWHLRLLAFFDGPASLANERGAFEDLREGPYRFNYDRIVEGVFPELRGRRRFYDQVLDVLERDGLISNVPMEWTIYRGPDGAWHVQGMRDELTTHVLTPEGREFLRFITAPQAGSR
jgi:hypothetical protein